MLSSANVHGRGARSAKKSKVCLESSIEITDKFQYLPELSENNNRAWFVMNKPRYDILRAEFLELVTKLIKNIAKFDPEVAACNPK